MAAVDNLTATLASWKSNFMEGWNDVKNDVKKHISKQSTPVSSPRASANENITFTTPAAEVKKAPTLKLPLGPFEADASTTLGEGGYAKVVLGRHRETGDKVAIKILDTRGDAASGRAASSEAAIVREVAALKRAGQHPNVCQLHGHYRLGEGGPCHAMVLELCTGGEMFRLVEKFGAIDEKSVRPLFSGMLEGVRHLHSVGIAHRDLKLENILLSHRGPDAVPKIVDLGLAHVHARGPGDQGWQDKALTQFCGSRSYCAPEVMARLGYNGYAADVWSLGVCLFGLVAGFFPVDEASTRDWRYERIARQQHVHPEVSTCHTIFGFYQRPCPLSPALVHLLDRMLKVAPAQRASLPEVSSAAWVHGHSVLAPPPASAPPARAPPAAALPAPPPAAEPQPLALSTPEVDPEDNTTFGGLEVDLTDFLTRSSPSVSLGEAHEDDIESAMHVDRSTLKLAESIGGFKPPMLCRQRAELSVGVTA